MNYIYDILTNFQTTLFDTFDWNIDDTITHIRKIPLFKVETKALLDVIKKRVKLNKEFLDSINNKTEFFHYKKINKIEYACLLSDGLEVIAVKAREDGIICEKSKLLYDEAEEVIEYCDDIDASNFEYEIIDEANVLIYKTRLEEKIGIAVEKELKLAINKDEERLKYLYFECFGEMCDDPIKIITKIKQNLKSNFDEIYPKIHVIFKLKTIE